MFRLDVSGRSLTIVAIASLMLLLLSSSAWAQHIGYPNPRNDQAIQPGHQFSFRAQALGAGGDPAGTQYNLQLRRRVGEDPDTWTAWVTQPTSGTSSIFTKSTDDEEEFTWNSNLADMTAVDPTSLPGLHINEVYQWRITSTGTAWTFHVPMAQPADTAEEVGVYPKFIWDEHPVHGAGLVEMLHLIDLDDPRRAEDYPKAWVTIPEDGGAPEIIGQHIMKTYDPRVPTNQDWHASRREFWIHDTNYSRLFPNSRRYIWRISYHLPTDGGSTPLYVDNDFSGDLSAGDDFVWADGGTNSSINGWNFETIDELYWPDYYLNTTESLVVYWQSQYGTMDRDASMGDYSFRTVAERVQQIHMTSHDPAVETVIAGTQEIAACYGGNHWDNPIRVQAPYTDDITARAGWYTIARAAKENPNSFPRARQDLYEEYVAKGIRTFLQDAANEMDFEDISSWVDDFAWMDNLQYVTLIGDAKRVAPSFFFFHDDGGGRNWTATDFYYITQGETAVPTETPKYQVGRIPIRAQEHRTTDYDGDPYTADTAAIKKLDDYAALINSDAKKDFAYDNWFGRAVFVSGVTEYTELLETWFSPLKFPAQWFQFYAAAAQNIISQRITVAGGALRDAFSGIKVREYNFWGNGEEELTTANVNRHLTNFTDPADVPGFVYLLSAGDPYWYNDGLKGSVAPLTELSSLSSTSFTDAYEDVTDGRRPLLVSSGRLLACFDNTIFADESVALNSLGEKAAVSPGGPIGVIGFASGRYNEEGVEHSRTYPDGTTYTVTWGGNGVPEDGGYIYPAISQGQLSLQRDGDTETALLGKVEFARRVAREYAKTSQPGLGNIFNHVLAGYIADHATELADGNQRELTTLMGATLLGDPALVLPLRQPAFRDNRRPDVSDTNPRTGTTVVGYTIPTPRYNSQGMAVHVIPRSVPYDPTVGAPTTLAINTDAPYVRVRILTPFVQSEVPGSWHDTTDTYWTSSDPEVCPTVDSVCRFDCELRRPSVHIVVIQAQNPAWVSGTDPEEWRWLQERWFWIQTVNQFVRNPNANILVIDDDNYDRFHLHGQVSEDREGYYVTPGLDGLGYAAGQDPAAFATIPALPYLNKYVGDSFQYQFWSSNMYHLDHTYGPELLAAQQYCGEITPVALKSFQDTRGVVAYFKGDNEFLAPNGFLFITNDIAYETSVFFSEFLTNGGRFFASDQNLSLETNWVDGVVGGTDRTALDYLSAYQNNSLGSISARWDTDYTNMNGLQVDTMSLLINDVNIAGGDGANNAIWTAETDPNGTEAATIFFYDEASGPGTIESSGSSAIQNRIPASGARSIFFSWPFEAIDTIGSVTPDSSGRANVMRQILAWLRNVPKPTPVYPADGASGISRAVVLEWTRIAESTYYRVYIGTNPNDLTQPGAIVGRDYPSYDPAKPGAPLEPLLDPQTRYYWRVDMLNQDQQTVTTGDVWSFTTLGPPAKAIEPDPYHTEEQVVLGKQLGWDNNGAVSYQNIYLWTGDDVAANGGVQLDPAPGSATHRLATNVTDMFYQPAVEFEPDTIYYWRVDTYNELSGAPPIGLNLGPAKGDLWQFTTITPPPKPILPSPIDGAINVPTSQILSWNPTERTDTYDVFIWTGNPLTPPATPTATGLTEATYVPTIDFNTSTQYYWQVRPVNEAGRQNTVDTWTFTTSAVRSPGRVTNMYPANGDANIPVDVTFTWTASTFTSTYRIFIGEGTLPATPTAVGLTTTSYTPAAPLTAGVIYSWRVDSVAADGTTITSSLVVRFVTEGGTVFLQAFDPTPADGATDVDLGTLDAMSWSAGATALSFDVYVNGIFSVNIPAGDTAIIGTFVSGTTYTWRVDTIYPDGSGGTFTVEGETWTFTTAGDPPPGTGGAGATNCFIATSAYEAAYRTAAGVVRTNFTGDYLIPADRVEKLDSIRSMRDSFLNKFERGRRFTAWYYAVGPYAAQAIRHNEPAKAAVRRMLLDPLSNISRQCEEPGD